MSSSDLNQLLNQKNKENLVSHKLPICSSCAKSACCITFSMTLGLILILLASLGSWGFEKLMHWGVGQNVVMKEANSDVWGSVPGKSGLIMVRNFSLYQFTNPMQFALNNTVPVLIEKPGYAYQELQEFLDRKFYENGNEVSYNFQQYFLTLNGTNDLPPVDVVNLGPLGVWYQLKNANASTIALQAFWSLISSLNDQITKSVYSQYLQSAVFTSEPVVSQFLMKIQPPLLQAQITSLYSDYNFGLNNQNGLLIWVEAGLQSPTNLDGAFALLSNYFHLSYGQIIQILAQVRKSIQTAQQLLIDGYYCGNIFSNYTDCSPESRRLFTAAQWANQSITLLAPSGPEPSIASTNFTAIGMPEIGFFAKDYGQKNPEYANITFPIDWAMRVLNYYDTPDPKIFIKDSDAILNIGNLNILYENGYAFDRTNQRKYLDVIQNRFRLNSTSQTRVFWEYAKYFLEEFAEDQSEGGSTQSLGLGAFGSQSLYQTFVQMGNWLLPYVTSAYVQQNLTDLNITTCQLFFKSYEADFGITQKQIDQICADPVFIAWDQQSILAILNLIWYPGNAWFQKFQSISGFSNQQLLLFQSPDSPLFQFVLSCSQDLATLYGCQIPELGCSNYEVAYKQWANSSITLTIPPNLKDKLKPAYSVADWSRRVFSKEFEYGYFVQQYSSLVCLQGSGPLKQLNYQTTQELLSFNNMFAASRINNAFIWGSSTNQTLLQNFTQYLLFEQPVQLLTYLRFLVINVGFDGIAKTRTINEVLFGWVEPLISQVKNQNPQMGGDPSLNDVLQLNEPNVTREQAYLFPQTMYTGKDDINMVRRYKLVNGKSYITYLKSWFDGNETHKEFLNPYAEIVPILGTDAGSNQPFMEKYDTIKVFISSIYKGGSGAQVEKTKFYGYDVYRYGIQNCLLGNHIKCPENAKLYAFGPNGLHNLTATSSAPVFLSGRNFQYGDSDLMGNITVYTDDKKTNLAKATINDLSWIVSEINSGATISVQLCLQVNFQFQNDLLFANLNHSVSYIPILSFFRGGTMPESNANELLGGIKDGNVIYLCLIIIGSVLGGFLVIYSVYLIWARNKIKQLIKYARDYDSDIKKSIEQSSTSHPNQQMQNGVGEQNDNYI